MNSRVSAEFTSKPCELTSKWREFTRKSAEFTSKPCEFTSDQRHPYKKQ
ncbi:hypothetical protein ACQKMY_11055 [Peribacillus frigoritolerans]